MFTKIQSSLVHAADTAANVQRVPLGPAVVAIDLDEVASLQGGRTAGCGGAIEPGIIDLRASVPTFIIATAAVIAGSGQVVAHLSCQLQFDSGDGWVTPLCCTVGLPCRLDAGQWMTLPAIHHVLQAAPIETHTIVRARLILWRAVGANPLSDDLRVLKNLSSIRVSRTLTGV